MATPNRPHPFIYSTIPVSQYSLPENKRDCPICLDPYVLPTTSIPHPGIAPGTREYAVMVQSRWPGSTCRHVFGRRCLEGHFRSGGPWSTKCPLCKEEWFPEGAELVHNDSEEEDSDEESEDGGVQVNTRNTVQAQAQARASVGVRIRIPSNLIVRVTHEAPSTTQRQRQEHDLGEGPSSRPAAGASGIPRRIMTNMEGLTNRGKLERSIDFLQWILLTDEVDDADLGLLGAIQGVEIAIEKLWSQLDVVTARRQR